VSELFTVENLGNLVMLIFLQAVLGFDNLLYISLESKRAPAASQKRVRRDAILVAIGLRILLLFAIVHLVEAFEEPFATIHWDGVVEGSFNIGTLIFLGGGVFIMFEALKEIGHMLSLDDLHGPDQREPKPAWQVVATIAVMNAVFSFDSILSALAISDVFAVLATAITFSGLLMILLADQVAVFLEKNRKYEVLGLFILLIVGVVLLGEGGHQAHLTLFGYRVEPLSKTTFYFSIFVLIAVDVVQSGYQRRLAAERALAQGRGPSVPAPAPDGGAE